VTVNPTPPKITISRPLLVIGGLVLLAWVVFALQVTIGG